MQKRMCWMRRKYKISVVELAGYSDVNHQRLSQIELKCKKATTHMEELVETAFESS